MKSALEAIRARALERLQNAEDLTALEEARVQLLGKKGELTAILKTMGQLSPEERPVMGQMANEVRAAIEQAVQGLYKGQNEESFWSLMSALNYALELETHVLVPLQTALSAQGAPAPRAGGPPRPAAPPLRYPKRGSASRQRF